MTVSHNALSFVRLEPELARVGGDARSRYLAPEFLFKPRGESGVKGGLRYGATNDLGSQAVERKMRTHDLHATVLHLLGLDHERLLDSFSLSGIEPKCTKKWQSMCASSAGSD